jgi:hypothetical protein
MHIMPGGQASEEQQAQLAGELALLRDQLVRVGAVAERAAVREVTAGPKDAGTVPVHQYLEEVLASVPLS